MKIVFRIFDAYEEEMLEDLEQGDVAETISSFFVKSKTSRPLEKGELTLQDVDNYLNRLAGFTKEEEQQHLLEKVSTLF
jgi:DNA ligase-3